ncbi:LysR family transcriptional regulator [Microbacterium rhizophilus]|uniref:LysR family transcriptional regulator n=1 Tax=Microbacterium rhizophilus TaxID=3138934 RepID=UPI0031EDFFB8
MTSAERVRMRTPDVSTDDLRMLLALARTGKLVTAATLLGIDHTTVSRRLRRLETGLGVTLVERGTDGWALSEIGRVVVERAAPLEQILQEVRDAVSGDEGTVRGSVRLSTPDGFGTKIASVAVAEVIAAHPGISVELVTSTRPISSRASGYDLAVSIGEPRQGWLASEFLTNYTLGLYASRRYLNTRPRIASPTDLTDHRLVFYVDSHLNVAELDLARRFAGMHVGLGCTNVSAQVEATLHGAGVGLLPCFMAEEEPDLIRVLPSEIAFTLAFSLSSRRNSPAPDAVGLIRQAIRSVVVARQDLLVPRT